MNTSLGNSWANFLLSWANISAQGEGWEDWDGVFEGDDAIVGTNTTLTSPMFHRFGFDVKLDELDDPMTGSFCGVIASGSGQMIRDPVKFFSKFGWTNTNTFARHEKLLGLLKAKAMSTLHETPHCPLISEFAYRAYLNTTHVEAKFVTDGYHEAITTTDWITPPKPTAETRILFSELFGIASSTQIVVEAAIRKGDYTLLNDIIVPHPDVEDYTVRFVERR